MLKKFHNWLESKLDSNPDLEQKIDAWGQGLFSESFIEKSDAVISAIADIGAGRRDRKEREELYALQDQYRAEYFAAQKVAAEAERQAVLSRSAEMARYIADQED